MGSINCMTFTISISLFIFVETISISRFVMLWQVNQKMLLTLTASIMFWSLQQAVDDTERSLSPVDASPATSINGEDESSSSLGGEISNLSIDDTASDTTVTSQFENEGSTASTPSTPLGDGIRAEEKGCIAVQ